MRSVADEVRAEQLRDMLRLTPAERVNLALRLGEEGLALFMSANRVNSRDEAIEQLRRVARAGRRGRI